MKEAEKKRKIDGSGFLEEMNGKGKKRKKGLILCLGSSDRIVDSTLANDLGLRLVHMDTCRAEEIADTVMALFLGLLRRTHLSSSHSFSASGWIGSVQPLCRGMRRCRGLVLGIVGRSARARSLANRSLAFKMSVLYFDVPEGKGRAPVSFPPAARRMDTLNDLLNLRTGRNMDAVILKRMRRLI